MKQLEPSRRSLVLFGLVATLLVAVPIWLIVAQERTLHSGEVFRFRTMPVDPYDAFRGRYVALGFPTAEAPLPADSKIERGQKVYVHLEHDEEGFARLVAVSPQPPERGNYLYLAVARIVGRKARFVLPFDRYYMNEFEAPEAERVYRRVARGEDALSKAWVEVRVHRGRAVLEQLYVEGRPIAEVLGSP